MLQFLAEIVLSDSIKIVLLVLMSVLLALLIGCDIYLLVCYRRMRQRENKMERLQEENLKSEPFAVDDNIVSVDSETPVVATAAESTNEVAEPITDAVAEQAAVEYVSTDDESDEEPVNAVLRVAQLSKQAREKLGVAGEEYDDKSYVVRYSPSFEARLRRSSDEVKQRYTELRNEIARYKGVKVKNSFRQERIYTGRQTLGLITFSGKNLSLALALDPKEFEDTKYHGEDKSGTKRYQYTPMCLKVFSDRKLGYAKVLLARLAEINGIEIDTVPKALTFDMSNKTDDELYVENKLHINILYEVTGDVAVEESEAIDEAIAEDVAEEVIAEEVEETEDVIRYNRSYTARLTQADDELKARYSELKNYILAYNNTSSKISWKHEVFSAPKMQGIISMAIRGKTLCVFFATDPTQFDGTKYKVVNLSDKNTSSKRQTMYRITSDRKVKFAKQIIDSIFAEKGVKANADYKTVNYRLPYVSTENLIKQGYIRTKTTTVAVKKADSIDNLSVDDVVDTNAMAV